MLQDLTIAALLAVPASDLGAPGFFQARESAAQQSELTKIDPQARLKAILARHRQVQSEFEEKLSQAKSEKEKAGLWAQRRGLEFLPEYKALALECKTADLADIAAQCWVKVCEIGVCFGKPNEALPAVDVLMKQHIQSTLIEVLPMLVHDLRLELGPQRTEKTLREIARSSTHDCVKANGWFALALEFLSPDPAPKERLANARLLFERLAQDYGQETSPYGPRYTDVAEGFLFEIDHLQVGMDAPGFEATDQDGQAFKLGDYKGSVVVIDFWGAWSDECRHLLARARDLLKALNDQPFAILGINSDGDAATVQQIMAENEVTWRQAIDGSQLGPLATRWNVRVWPTVYVLDKKGVIRFKNIRGKQLEAAVKALLAETEENK